MPPNGVPNGVADQARHMAQMTVDQAPQAMPAAWYHCSTDPAGSLRLWDGRQWTATYRPY
jgi:hypothetical protein